MLTAISSLVLAPLAPLVPTTASGVSSVRPSLSSSEVHHLDLFSAVPDIVIPLSSSFGNSKPIPKPGDWTSQSAGTSKAIPHLGFTTTFQPAMVGFSVSVPRGLSSEMDAESLGSVDADVDGLEVLFVSPPALSSLFPPRTRKPVTPAATTTAAAATIATTFVRLPPSPPPWGGCGAPMPSGVPHCGCCPYGLGCW